MKRTAHITRTTQETSIDLRLDLDSASGSSIETGIGFFDHMLSHVAKHGGLRLTLSARGDLHIDEHHLIEDVGICLWPEQSLT
ncbi:MAG: Imidazoleglycerol-phosphate dehydratase [Bacteroidetes bacterium]|nr:Imidazoleglycerol-phosphate dehydratase [Bacteroidota bacterium]